jgi:hypothetical protein
VSGITFIVYVQIQNTAQTNNLKSRWKQEILNKKNPKALKLRFSSLRHKTGFKPIGLIVPNCGLCLREPALELYTLGDDKTA